MAIELDLAIARLLLSLVFGVGIGMIMALIFSREDATHDKDNNDVFAGQAKVRRRTWIFLLLLVALLLFGTLKIGLLTNSYGQVTLPTSGMDRFQEALDRLVPYDASRGEEGLTTQGAILIALLILIGISAWLGLNSVDEGFNRWTQSLGIVRET